MRFPPHHDIFFICDIGMVLCFSYLSSMGEKDWKQHPKLKNARKPLELKQRGHVEEKPDYTLEQWTPISFSGLKRLTTRISLSLCPSASFRKLLPCPLSPIFGVLSANFFSLSFLTITQITPPQPSIFQSRRQLGRHLGTLPAGLQKVFRGELIDPNSRLFCVVFGAIFSHTQAPKSMQK